MVHEWQGEGWRAEITRVNERLFYTLPESSFVCGVVAAVVYVASALTGYLRPGIWFSTFRCTSYYAVQVSY